MSTVNASETTIKFDILESYYIQSKFKFHVIAPAIVDENDYYDNENVQLELI